MNLLNNPEKFTGYAGDSAHRIWHAVYEENCFDTFGLFNKQLQSSTPNFTPRDQGSWSQLVSSLKEPESNICMEKQVYYRMVSGCVFS